MSQSASDSPDSIPTLTQLVVPGDPNKARAIKVHVPGETDHEPSGRTAPGDEGGKRPGFRASIDGMIEEVLKRHLEQARQEITSRVIAEIVSRRPQNRT